MEKVRILHVLGRLDRGGAETMIMNMYRHIDRSRIQFDFIIHTEETCDYSNEVTSLGGVIYSVPAYNGRNHFKYKSAWRNFFKEHPEYKIIHGHVRSTGAIYLKIAKRFGLATIAHSHNTSSGKGLDAIVKNLLQYPLRHTADILLACSVDAGRWLFGKKIDQKSNFKVIKNAIDIDKYKFNEGKRDFVREQTNLKDKYIIGHVGRLCYQKNQLFLIDVFVEILKVRSDAILMLIGEGELRGEIEKKISDNNLEKHVILIGSVENVNDYFQAMDVFVFPSHYEGLGIVLIEAQAAGLKCVVSDNIPNEAIVTKLVKTMSLNSSINSWVNEVLHKPDNHNRTDIKVINAIKNKGYSISDLTEEMETFYLSLLNREVK